LHLVVDGVWCVPLRVPVIEPSAATMAVPVETSAMPFAVVISLNEKLEKLPPPHAINDPIAVAIASHFIIASKPGRNQLIA
jgi:hypothetical protein